METNQHRQDKTRTNCCHDCHYCSLYSLPQKTEPLVTLSVQGAIITTILSSKIYLTRMWANVQRDGRPAEYWWRPMFNAAKFG